MAEPGWPLIPREVLPAPVRPAPIRPGPSGRAPARSTAGSESGRQLSIFGAEATDPSPADLVGLLAGPARLGRMGGTARVSVRVDAAWRVHVLVAELVSRGLVVQWLPIEDQPPIQDQPLEVRHTDAPPESRVPPHTGDDASPPNPAAGRGSSANGDTAASGVAAGSDRAAGSDGPADSDRSVGSERSAGVGGPAGSGRPAGSGGPAGSDHPVGVDAGTDAGVGGDAVGGDAGGRRGRPGVGVAVFEVRTAYSSRLNGLARAWPAAADQLFLSGPRLRLWVAAAGRPRDGGYALGLDPHKSIETVDSALRRMGLAGSVSEDGLHYLIAGRKRVDRLAELVGDRPEAAPAAMWPGGARA